MPESIILLKKWGIREEPDTVW